ncbi:hypothetical protein SDRG_04892 [Saprolegnia diclina VS20]|uniref:Uncharacterized protein n=1 Tax=Saprolegnia diclina (strain VS20) TaxID=1156394 RepID=T0QT38_SAPDV|nr:hypothetical protein SDRG_04892 [Saprolegnia diclina VS20]EQC37871.1 hypothetical protein SDRG_04892 [Saprolegnia diclina VS20]|eukprot:XP_008608804.1 hypothetical protein SDRG_04892 [Saprolegnia diclina VS20]
MVYVFYAMHLAESASSPPALRPVWAIDDFECIGWQSAGTCGDERDQRNACTEDLKLPAMGACVISNRSSGATLTAMRSTCSSTKHYVQYSCRDARAFMDFGPLSERYVHTPTAPIFTQPWYALEGERGIVMVVQSASLVSAFASIHSLRALGCSLPIELWYRSDETALTDPILTYLLSHDMLLSLRRIQDPRATGFYTKPYALFYSAFQHVLLLDTDNFAIADPTYLFDLPAYKAHGAVFWPDFWQPTNSIFNVHNESLLWELLDLPPVDMFEQESGQVLVDRRRHERALHMLMFYAIERPPLLTRLRLVWGDKDLYRLAWLKTKSSFRMVARPPGALGVHHPQYPRFCGLSMVQYDDVGREIFFHRNTRKLSRDATANARYQWTHLQAFRLAGRLTSEYRPASWDGSEQYGESACFGVELYMHAKLEDGSPAYDVIAIKDTPFAHVEATLLGYARIALQLAKPAK